MIKNIIKTIEKFEDKIGPDEIEQILSTPLNLEDVSEWVRFSNEKYTRNRIFGNKNLELLVLCWEPGQGTPPHDHGGSTGGFRVIAGVAKEIAYETESTRMQEKGVSYFGAGFVSAIDAEGVHKIVNPEDSNAKLISVHIYSPPLTEYKKYENIDDRLEFTHVQL